MPHKIYFPEDGSGEPGPVGYDVCDVAPAPADGDLERVTVTFEDGSTETVPAAHVFDCDDVTCEKEH